MKPTRSDHLSDEDLARRGLSRETDIVLDAEGRFFSGGVEVVHPGVAAAFARWIERNGAGRYVLRNDLHYVYIEVQGAPLHARGLAFEEQDGELRAFLLLQGGVREPLRPETLRLDGAGALYASARDGTWPVRLDPQAVLELEPYLEEGPSGVVLRFGAFEGTIPELDDPFAP